MAYRPTTNPSRKILGALAAAAALLMTARPSIAGARPDDPDRQELLRLQEIYQEAMRGGDLTALLPLLDDGFQAVAATGEPIRGREGFAAYLEKVRRFLRGRGSRPGSYQVELQHEELVIEGGRASARGRTRETLTFGTGETYRYRALWRAQMAKVGGHWRLTGMQTSVDAFDPGAVAFRKVAEPLWRPPVKLRPLRPGEPDWDGDHGNNDKDSAAAQPAQGSPRTTARSARAVR